MKGHCFKICLGVFLLLFVVSMAQADEPYNLGVDLAITGTGALYCKDGVDAITLAVKEINAQGGFLGKHPIKLFIRDTQPEQSSSTYAEAKTTSSPT